MVFCRSGLCLAYENKQSWLWRPSPDLVKIICSLELCFNKKCLLYVQIKTNGHPPPVPRPGRRINNDLSCSDLDKLFIYRIWNFSSLDLCPTNIREKLYLKQSLNLWFVFYIVVCFKTSKLITAHLTIHYPWNPILDTRISGLPPSSVTLRVPPVKSETGWTGELWSNCVHLILKN